MSDKKPVAYRTKEGRCVPATALLARFQVKMQLEPLYAMPAELGGRTTSKRKEFAKEVEESTKKDTNDELEAALDDAFRQPAGPARSTRKTTK